MGARTLSPAAFLTAAFLAAGIFSAGALTGPAPAAAQASAADVQWAQDTLKSKGYDLGGRPSTKWTEGSRKALTAFQRAQGLPATGQLDAATMEKLGSVRKAPSSMGVLGAPSSSGSAGSGGTAKREAPPQPKAVPTTRVGAEGGETGVIGGVTLGQAPAVHPGAVSPGAASSGASYPGQPQAVPVPRVDAQDSSPTAAPRAQVFGGDGAPAGGALGTEQGFHAANWMRYGVGGLLAATLAAMGWGWWRSGRRRAAAAGGLMFEADDDDDRASARMRVEPSFGAAKGPSAARPTLTAPSRPRR